MSDTRDEIKRQIAHLYQMAEAGQIAGIGFAIVRPNGAAQQGWVCDGIAKIATLASAHLLLHHLTNDATKAPVAAAADEIPAQLN